MKYVTDCPLCRLRFHREYELIYHLRTDHDGERSAALADLIERTTRQRRAEGRRRARGVGAPTRGAGAQTRPAVTDDTKLRGSWFRETRGGPAPPDEKRS